MEAYGEASKGQEEEEVMAPKHKNERFPLVEVYWEDCMGGSGWRDTPERIKEWEHPHSMLHSSGGYLVRKTRRYIVLTISRSLVPDSESIGDFLQIPRKTVKHIEVIRRPK